MDQPGRNRNQQTQKKHRSLKIKRSIFPSKNQKRRKDNQRQYQHGLRSQEQEQSKRAAGNQGMLRISLFQPMESEKTGENQEQKSGQIDQEHFCIGDTGIRRDQQGGQFTEYKE